MTTNPKGYINSYYHKRRKEVIKLLGNKCNNPNCKETIKLEFAHIKETNVKGYGQSGWARLYDVLKNPKSYILLCKKHHEELDHYTHKGYNECHICSIYAIYGIPTFCFNGVNTNV